MVSSSVKNFELVLEREGMYNKKRQVIATYSNPTKLPTKTCKWLKQIEKKSGLF